MNAPAAKRRTPWIIVGAIGIVLLVTAAVVWLLIPRGTPEDQARAYLQALSDGEISAVEATGVDVPATAAAAFVDASDRLRAGAVETSTSDGQDAIVVVTYELAGARHEGTLTLSQRNGRWVPNAASALGSVKLSVPAAVAGTVLPTKTTALLPAVYDVSAVPAEFLDGSATIEVLPGSTQEIDVDATLRPEATDAAQAQLDDHLATCTTPAAEAPPSCGIAIPWAADFSVVTEIHYRIEQAPAISLTPSAFRAEGGVLVATVTGTALDGKAKTLTYRSTSWGMRGDVSFTDNDIVLSVW